MDARSEPRLPVPRAVDLRRGPAPEIVVLTSPAYDFLVSLHVSLATPETDYADYAVGRAWVASARARCAERDPHALSVLGRYLGDGGRASLHATLLSLVWRCPEPRVVPHFLEWLGTIPAEQLAEVLLDQEGLGADWGELLARALAEEHGQSERPPQGSALDRLLLRYSAEVRETVASVVRTIEQTRADLLAALHTWYEAVYRGEEARLEPMLQREVAALERRRTELPLEQFVEQAMHGVQWQRPVGLRRIVFAPSYFCRPAVFYHFWHGTLTFCAPLEYASPEAEAQYTDPRAPSEETLQFFEVLGDPTRLRILRLLAERELYLTELADRLGLSKATTKHHMVRLRTAGLVTLYVRDRLTYYALRPDVPRRAAQLLGGYLGGAAERTPRQ